MSAPHVLAKDFEAPGLWLFQWKPLFHIGPVAVAKPMVLSLIVMVVVVAFFWAAFAKPKLVPRGVQNLGEMAYIFVRDEMGRPFLGKDTEKWMRLLVPLFFFVWIGNLMSVIPVAQFPVNSRIAFPMVLAVLVYLTFWTVGVKSQGFFGLLKNSTMPPDLPAALYIIVIPIEFVSVFLIRPFTHAVRLFANMFAGHILIALFATVGFHFLWEKVTPLGFGVGVLGVILTIVMTAFELFIQAVQAYVFTLLAAFYISAGLHADH
ncbi:F0F1 ATP synthase subunit A [Actinoallomurus rhizosphaericola]|uniref:F0F1 ATP synthase subunit A n=1 Tax=Actinoallomurus rhizosphaericola TaxID=2952536 RepID=UPI002090DEBE|nr:F0F1 ATP synthase subunit A [Actinoallomurus rhizosphaericola]MCO5993942.1 F0F1 ATP synthase subunit A [Actinoallomurus rhizosphaericola]